LPNHIGANFSLILQDSDVATSVSEWKRFHSLTLVATARPSQSGLRIVYLTAHETNLPEFDAGAVAERQFWLAARRAC